MEGLVLRARGRLTPARRPPLPRLALASTVDAPFVFGVVEAIRRPTGRPSLCAVTGPGGDGRPVGDDPGSRIAAVAADVAARMAGDVPWGGRTRFALGATLATVGGAPALADPERRSAGDRLAGTRIVRDAT